MLNRWAGLLLAACTMLDAPLFAQVERLTLPADRSAIYEAPQHAGVKSEKIGAEKITAERTREEVLSPEFRGKVDRYVAAWKRESGDKWPSYPQTIGNGAPAGALEQLNDEIYYRALRVLDRFTAWVYCHAPIDLLRKYRGAKVKPETTAAKPVAERAALSEASTRN